MVESDRDVDDDPGPYPGQGGRVAVWVHAQAASGQRVEPRRTADASANAGIGRHRLDFLSAHFLRHFRLA